jgi:Xaa-Pro aminopeptidase
VAEVVARVLRDLGARRAEVPRSFPLGLAMEIDALGIRLDLADDPFWPEREIKTAAEVRAIAAACARRRRASRGIAALRLLPDRPRRLPAPRRPPVHGGGPAGRGQHPHPGRGLRPVAHDLRAGRPGGGPHEEGHGPIRAHTPVVMDIFPRSESTGYYGDLTRTVVRGPAPARLHEVYAVVHQGVRLGHSRIRPGAEGRDIHERSRRSSSARDTRPAFARADAGLLPRTGHGLGLQIHEPPSISGRRGTLRAGHVVTVEPGLYYLAWAACASRTWPW